MTPVGFRLFETAIGACGIAWSETGVTAVQLSERTEAATRARLVRKSTGAKEAQPPPAVRSAIEGIVALLEGRMTDLAGVVLDLDGVAEFDRRVLAVALTIGPGETLTYGEIATRIGEAGAARAVGAALGRNPIPIIVPCHRVLAADGGAGGFSAPGGVAAKARLLSIEGARTSAAPMLFDALPIAVKPARRL